MRGDKGLGRFSRESNYDCGGYNRQPCTDVQREDHAVVLLSIQPRFAEGILNGSKRVELRRTGFAHAPRYVVVYATQPVGKVVGVFEVEQIVDDSPTEIWQRYFAVSGLEREEYDRYYQGASKAVAIEIAKVHELSTPVPLSQLEPTLRPPQSFQYLPPAALRKLGLGHEV